MLQSLWFFALIGFASIMTDALIIQDGVTVSPWIYWGLLLLYQTGIDKKSCKLPACLDRL
ncbi:hypothetical protein SAMN05443246_0179 [Paenibacillus sp. GP183]|nr:hypothetical protein SAMN05443246_0179 [Paenibacillus sp. GP183]